MVLRMPFILVVIDLHLCRTEVRDTGCSSRKFKNQSNTMILTNNQIVVTQNNFNNQVMFLQRNMKYTVPSARVEIDAI